MDSGLPSPLERPQIFSAVRSPVRKPTRSCYNRLSFSPTKQQAQTDSLHIDHLTFSEDEARNTISCNPDFWFDSYSNYRTPLTSVRNRTPARLSNIRNPPVVSNNFSTSNYMAQRQLSLLPPSKNEECDLEFKVVEQQQEAPRAGFWQSKKDNGDSIHVEHLVEVDSILDEALFDGDEQISIGDAEDYYQDSEILDDACEAEFADWEREVQNEGSNTPRKGAEVDKLSSTDNIPSTILHLGDDPAKWKAMGIPVHQISFSNTLCLTAHSSNFADENEKSAAEDDSDQTHISKTEELVLHDHTANYDGGTPPSLSRNPVSDNSADRTTDGGIKVHRSCSVLSKPHYPNKQRPPTFDTGILRMASPLPQPAIPLAPSEREKKEESQRKSAQKPFKLNRREAANVRVTSMLWRCSDRGVLTIRRCIEIMKRQHKPGRERNNPVFQRRRQRILDQDPKHTIWRAYKRSPLANELTSTTVQSHGCSMQVLIKKLRDGVGVKADDHATAYRSVRTAFISIRT